MRLPKVSIIIPAYNEEKNIEDVLRSATNLDYPKEKLEIILVDDGSTDKTLEKAKKYKIKILRGKHEGVGVSRNLGWKRSNGDLVFFLDADQKIDRGFLRKMVPYFSDSKIAAVDCAEEMENKDKIIARMHYLKTVLGIRQYDFPFAKLCRKLVLKELGGINPEYGYYDDWEFTYRILKNGHRIVRNPNAIVYHNQPENFNEVWRQNRWSGRSIIFLFKNYKMQMVRKLLFPIICAPIPLYILFLFLPPFFKFIGILGISVFLLMETMRVFRMFMITKMFESVLTPIFDVITMDLYSIGIIIGLLNSKKTPKA